MEIDLFKGEICGHPVICPISGICQLNVYYYHVFNVFLLIVVILCSSITSILICLCIRFLLNIFVSMRLLPIILIITIGRLLSRLLFIVIIRESSS